MSHQKKNSSPPYSNNLSCGPINSAPDMSKITRDKITAKVSKYSKYLFKTFGNYKGGSDFDFTQDFENNFDFGVVEPFYEKIGKKFNLSNKCESLARFHSHLCFLLAVLKCISEQTEYNTESLRFLLFLMQTCSLFEQDSVTGLFTLKIVDSPTPDTIFHINNNLYFKEAKIYLTKIQKNTHISIPDFNPNPNPNPNPNKQITAFYVFQISNTHVNILLNKIYKNRKFISSLSKQPNHSGRGVGPQPNHRGHGTGAQHNHSGRGVGPQPNHMGHGTGAQHNHRGRGTGAQHNHRGRGVGAHRPSGHGVGPHRPRGRGNDRSKPYPVPPSSGSGSRKPVRGGRSISASIVHGMDNLNLR